MLRLRLTAPPARPRVEEHDLVVVGAGPAGITAGIYAARYAIDTVVVAKEPGGQVAKAGWIENYPGFERIRGPELAERMLSHLKSYGVPLLVDEVVDVKRSDSGFEVKCRSGRIIKAKAVILALGVKHRRLNVPGEDKLLGRGVSYCAVCDAPLFRDKIVAVVGGGDSAASSALLLAEYARKVYLIHRRGELRAQPIYRKQLAENPKIEVLYNRQVLEIIGDKRVEALKLLNKETGREEILRVDGVFVEIGVEPPTDFARRIGLDVDEKGYIKVDRRQATSIPGIFAAGDCTNATPLKQVVTAAAQGAVAAASAYEYIQQLTTKKEAKAEAATPSA